MIGIGVLTPVTYASAKTSGNLHGTVVDINGDPVEDVKVMAYLNTGSLEETDYTDKEGYFRMNLGGTYTLVFEKNGFASEVMTVQVTQAPTTNEANDVVKLGLITLDPTLELTASAVKRNTSPGSTLELIFQIINNGENVEHIEFNVDAPSDWNTRIIDQVSEIENIQLSQGIEEFTLEIQVPENAEKPETISIFAEGSSIAELEFIISPSESHEVDISSTYLSVTAELGDDIILPLTVTNNDDAERAIELTTIIPDDWAISIETITGMGVRSIYLKPGESESLTIVLRQPDEANVGDYEVSIQAETPSGVFLGSLSIEVFVIDPTSEVEVISTFSDVTIEAGSSVEFPLAVWNQGGSDTLFLLSVEGVSDTWDNVFVTNDVEVSSVLVGAGESAMLQFMVDPPSSVQTGDYRLSVFIESDNGFYEELTLSITVEGSYELELELSTLYTTTNIGETVTYTAQVTNQGQTTVTTLFIDAVLPEDWEATITPNQIDSLDPRDTVTFAVKADVPSDTSAGDYLVTMQAISDQLESDEIDIRITAQTSNTWGYLGIGLAVVAIAGAIMVFRTFKRR
jgi:uncharacterized membrane protein